MKKFIAVFVCMILFLPQCVWATGGDESIYRTYYVSYENGSDSNDGKSENAPFKTLAKAKEVVRTESSDMTGDIVVNVMEGYHFLSDTLYFLPEDSGKNGHNIIWKGENLPVVSGGRRVTGFKKSEKGTNVYEAHVPGLTHLMNIYVNGEKRFRASSEVRVTPVRFWDDKETRYTDDGLYMKKTDIGFFENPEDIQFFYVDDWVQNYVKVEEILEDPENADNVICRMDKNIWTYSNPSIDTKWREITTPLYIQNAMELMDNPGEFYYNKSNETLYYIPVDGENMETATVIVPVLEKLVDMFGTDVDEKVENITFDGIKFAHTTWEALANGSSTPRQAQAWLGWFSDISVSVPGAIELQMTKNVNFCNNHFFGLQVIGLFLKDGAEESNIEGNAFYNLGDAAIVVGLPYIYDNEVSLDYLDGTNMFIDGVSPDVQSNATDKRRINVGYSTIAVPYYSITAADHKIRNLHASDTGGQLMRNWVKEEDYTKYRGTWKSNPDVIGMEKAWVRYDLERPYAISEISFMFDPEKTTPEQRSGYEVLVSNKRDFSEYKTVATQTTDSGNLATFVLDENMRNEKYRFIMIRTLSQTQLALSGAIFISTDLKPGVVWERCKNINISNNFITCVGEAAPCSGGMNIMSAMDTKVTHNKITNLPYSGIMASWGWLSTRVTAKNIEISHNWIENVGQLLYDGGGIYTLSRIPGGEVHDNVVKNPNLSVSSYYLDNGTSATYHHDNVTIGAIGQSLYVNSGCVENVTENNYSDTAGKSILSSLADNDFDSPILFDSFLNDNETVNAIIANAGLTDEYKNLPEIVGEREYKLPYSREIFSFYGSMVRERKNNAEQMLSKIINTGDFGTEKGQFSGEYLFELLKAYEEYNAGDKDDKIQPIIDILNRGHKVNSEDKEETDIYCVYALGAEDFEIDASEKKVVLEYPYGTDLSDKKVMIYTADKKSVAYNYDKVDLSKPLEILVYSEETKKFDIWNLEARVPDAEKKTRLNKDDWMSKNGESLAENKKGGKYLSASIYSYEAMIDEEINQISFDFETASSKQNGQYVFTVGRKTDGASQMKIVFKNNKAMLYEVNGGKEILSDVCEVSLSDNGMNNLAYTITPVRGDRAVFMLSINGKAIFHAATKHQVDNSVINYSSQDSGIVVY